MGWDETHRYYRALREIEAHLDRVGNGIVPWHSEYAEIFGDRPTLMLALRTRWNRLVETQVDEASAFDGAPGRQLQALAAAHPGLVRALVRDARPVAVTGAA